MITAQSVGEPLDMMFILLTTISPKGMFAHLRSSHPNSGYGARQTRRRGCFKSHNSMLDLEVKLIPYGSWVSPTTSSGALRLNRNRVNPHLSEERPASRIGGCRCSLALDGVPRDQCGKLSYRSARLGASGQLERT